MLFAPLWKTLPIFLSCQMANAERENFAQLVKIVGK